jgi:tellurite resistance protein
MEKSQHNYAENNNAENNSVENHIAEKNRLENFPVSFFSVVMGLCGLTIAWEKAQHAYNLQMGITPVLVGIATAVFALLFVLYVTKIVKYTSSVKKELKHPVKLSFFPSISISFILLSITYLNINEAISRPLWIIGAILHLGFTLYIVSVWMHHEHFKVNHINPAWFIPAVGNVLVPIAGVTLGYTDVSWFFFSIGMMFWIVLMTIFFNRILFHDPMDKHLLPTLFILIAPPAVGFLAYMRLNGGMDNFAHFLYFAALFLTLLLLSQTNRFISLPFFLSWWAYSFPLAAITISSFVVYENTQKGIYLWIASGLLVLVTIVVGIIIAATLNAIRKKGICVGE